MWKRLTNNWVLKLTSLALALALWSHVRGQVNPWEVAALKVKLNGTPPRGYVLQQDVRPPRLIVVTVRGPRLALRQLKGGGPANPLAGDEPPIVSSDLLHAFIDYNSPHEGDHRYPIKAETSVDDVEIVATKPVELLVGLDEAGATTLPIRTEFDLPGLWNVKSVQTSVQSATLSGPAHVLSRVASVRAVVAPESAKAGAQIFQSVPLVAYDKAGRKLSGIAVEPSATDVRARLTEREIEKVIRLTPKITGEPTPGFTVFSSRVVPSQITVKGSVKALDGLESLPATLDVGGAKSDRVAKIEVKLPAGVSPVSPAFVQVLASIKPIAVESPTPSVDAVAKPTKLKSSLPLPKPAFPEPKETSSP